ncbi:2-dehydro-3-deoxy-6-phosphogalactonate aldolase [Novosphingobium aquae]|uniref:2-dehydro-3-deoxy-6-phosphogalactonate aldolase n=1 Tax=Novosphingobium aquae TaxID=3133435 RepID=A0ABU8S9Z8_9SPHN
MNTTAFDDAFARCPLIAILRGLTPDEAVPVGMTLVQAGFSIIEVPLNSPQPFESIRLLAEELEGQAIIGAGTVLSPSDVDAVAEAGGTVIIAPNTDASVIERSVKQGLVAIPGVATPTEAFAALRAGASALKLFPAEGSSPAMLKAMRTVLPQDLRLLPVGGITPETMGPWLAAGAAGFGLGSALYCPGSSPIKVGNLASKFVATLSLWRSRF